MCQGGEAGGAHRGDDHPDPWDGAHEVAAFDDVQCHHLVRIECCQKYRFARFVAQVLQGGTPASTQVRPPLRFVGDNEDAGGQLPFGRARVGGPPDPALIGQRGQGPVDPALLELQSADELAETNRLFDGDGFEDGEDPRSAAKLFDCHDSPR